MPEKELAIKNFSLNVIRKRLFAFLLAITFIFLFVLGRVFYVQIVDGKSLQEKAIDQWTRELPVKAKRGKIVDRNGIVLAENKQTYAVYVRTRVVDDPEKTANVLSEVLGVEKYKLLEKLGSDSSSEITVKRQVDSETVGKLSKYGLKGVYYCFDVSRNYVYGDSLAQILGYVSSDGRGQSGLEKRYDEILRGYDGEILYEADLVGKDVTGKTAKYIPATDGLNVKLTIDYEIQQVCDMVIRRALNEYSPKSVSVMVASPKTGQILAVSQYPSFDLNDVPRDDTVELNEVSRSFPIVDSYEPGSTFKIITSAANIEEYLNGNPKAFSLNYVFNSNRYRIVDGRKIKCWSNHANGKHSNERLTDALNNSCNPCFVDIALSLGKETMYKYIEAFNFGKTTGVDFGGEASGMLIPKNAVTSGDLARIGFGQSIAVTPIQLLTAVSAAINGGVYYEPYFVKEIYDESGKIAEIINPKQVRRVISEDASSILRGYLRDVVAKGSGKQAEIEGFSIGGKTSTAQLNQDGKIVQGRYIMGFIGFFPSNDPEYIAICSVKEPVGGQYGSTVAAPLVKAIFQGIIDSKNLKPVNS